MSDNPRIEELQKRVEKDPTSIAFAQLAEEYRRIGEYQKAVEVCRDGLSRHQGYVSARVTLARSLMELGQFAAAKSELQDVLSVAPDNLAAIRALADIHQKAGDVEETFHFEAPTPAPAEDLPLPDPTFAEPAADTLDAAPAFDALDSMSLDLPPLPDLNWDFDVALQIDVPSPSEPSAPSEPFEPSGPSGPAEPTLRQLEGWLDAILTDRANAR